MDLKTTARTPTILPRRVPSEISDHILDFLAPPPITSQTYTPDDHESERICALVACAVVCHDFVPRARFHLLSTAWINSGKALQSLTNILHSNHKLMPLIKRFVVAPRVWDSLGMPAYGYFPFLRFFALNCPIRHLVLSSMLWEDSAYPVTPPYHLSVIRPRNSIAQLQLSGVQFPSLTAVFGFIRSFLHLTHLSVVGILFEDPPTDLQITRLQEHPNRQCWAAASLRTLELGGPGEGVIPAPAARLLGSTIERFQLTVHVGEPIDPLLLQYPDCLSTYKALQSLGIVIQPWARLKPPQPGSADEAVRVWNTIHDYLLSLIRAVPPDTLRMLKISLNSQQDDMETTKASSELDDTAQSGEDPWNLPCRYRNTRISVLDTVFASDLRDLLVSPAFRRLTILELHVHDNSPNAGWWRRGVQTRIPGLRPDVIQAVVKPHTHWVYDGLWDDGMQTPEGEPEAQLGV